MFWKSKPQPAPEPQPPMPLCQVCSQAPSVAMSTTLGYVCEVCWQMHLVPPVQPPNQQRSLCCPACKLAQSEESREEAAQWTGAKLCYGWELCGPEHMDHQARISALVQRAVNKNDAALDLSVLLYWYRYKNAQRVPEPEGA